MTFLALFQRRNHRVIISISIVLVIAGLLWQSKYFYHDAHVKHSLTPASSPPHFEVQSLKTLVVSSMVKDDVTWLKEHFSDWDIKRYIVDSSSAQFTVPKNKGRESMVYLTYIIDNYDHLPDLTVFIHGARYQWHNDHPLYDGIPMLRNLQVPHLLSEGYANLRCVWTLGCPSELLFNGAAIDEAKTTNLAYEKAFHELFPDHQLPDTIGVACCAQFSVTRATILQRPITDYQRYRQWLLDTPLEDHISGRIFEYSWHFMFGKEYVHCPNAKECYCKTFGLCELRCDDEGKCGERWPFPPSSSLPKGWPEMGWDGARRNESELERMKNVAMPNLESQR